MVQVNVHRLSTHALSLNTTKFMGNRVKTHVLKKYSDETVSFDALITVKAGYFLLLLMLYV